MAKKPIKSMCEDAAKIGPGRPRCPVSKAAVLKAAQEILEDGGIGALNIEAVAKKAGVAKTTIYRWWPSRGALAIDVFLDVAEKRSPFPRDGSAVDGFKQQMKALAKLLRGNMGRAAAAIMAEAQTDDDTRKAFLERYMAPRRAAGRLLYERGVANKEFREGIDPGAVGDALYAPLYFRLLLRHAPLDDDAVDKMVDLVLEGLRP